MKFLKTADNNILIIFNKITAGSAILKDSNIKAETINLLLKLK
jgi:hypothetical protein